MSFLFWNVDHVHELIDTLWNVNTLHRRRILRYCLELIDTLWNVNIRKEPGTSLVTYELIDTLWNVN